MPSTKQFEYLTLHSPFGIDYMDMYEMADYHSRMIKQLFEKIEEEMQEGFKACVEIPDIDEVVYIWKEEDTFILESSNIREREEKTPIGFYNWAFSMAPFFAMVGKGYHVSKGR
jgi:hypothetical protein